jgi:hypothetical protein
MKYKVSTLLFTEYIEGINIQEKELDRVYKYSYNIDINVKYTWNNKFLDYGTCRVTSVEKNNSK